MRTLLVLEWVRDDAGVAIARVEADAFCHSMVRSLIGTLLEVGDGKRDVEWPAAAWPVAIDRRPPASRPPTR